MSEVPDYSLRVAPRASSPGLMVYLDSAGIVWARDPSTGIAYALSPTSDVNTLPEAPTDGQLYGRQNSGWVLVPAYVALAGTINGQFDMSGTYAVDLAAAFPYTITALSLRVTSGTCTATLNC